VFLFPGVVVSDFVDCRCSDDHGVRRQASQHLLRLAAKAVVMIIATAMELADGRGDDDKVCMYIYTKTRKPTHILP
jgi:hypothetical protein